MTRASRLTPHTPLETYYEHASIETGAPRAVRGIVVAYDTLGRALARCPSGFLVVERHREHGISWAGSNFWPSPLDR